MVVLAARRCTVLLIIFNELFPTTQRKPRKLCRRSSPVMLLVGGGVDVSFSTQRFDGFAEITSNLVSKRCNKNGGVVRKVPDFNSSESSSKLPAHGIDGGARLNVLLSNQNLHHLEKVR